MSKQVPGDAPVYLELTVVNAATGGTVIYAGESATLTLQLINMTGGLITIIAGSEPSTLEIYLPDFFSLEDLGKMKITDANWGFNVNDNDQSLMLTCVNSFNWQNGETLTFSITGVQSGATPPQGGTTQVNPSGMGGTNIPAQVNTVAALTFEQDTGGQADLSEALLVSLDWNTVYVSEGSNNLISNSLSLNIKNTLTTPLYTGTDPWGSTPQVLVFFVYGNYSGALNRIDKSIPKDESGWAITPGQMILQGNDWSISTDNSDGSNQPQWLLEPGSSVLQILGTGLASNVTFEFDNIVTLNALGHTQMYVLFTGFPGYKNHLFTLDIVKQPLPQPGLIRFYATIDSEQIQSPDQALNIPLKWMMTGVNEIKLKFETDNYHYVEPIDYKGVQPILQQDTYTFQKSIQAKEGETLYITCIAYDGDSNELNRIKYPVSILFLPVVTSYTGTLQTNGSMVLSWQSEAAENITIPGIDPNLLATDGSLTIQPTFPLLNNDWYKIQAIQSASLKSQWYAFNQITQYQVLPTIHLPISNSKNPGMNPALGIAISPDGKYAFVGSWGYGDAIRMVSLESLTQVAALDNLDIYAAASPKSLVVSPDSQYLYTANSNSGSVTKFGINEGSFNYFSMQTGIGSDLTAIGISPKGDQLYITDAESNSLFILDSNSLQVIRSASTGRIPMGLAVSSDGTFIYVSNSGDNNVLLFDVREDFAHTTFQVGKSPQKIAISPDGKHVFVVNTGDNTVSVISDNNPNTIRTIQTGYGPYGIAISPDGGSVFVSNPGDNSISIISVATMNVLQTIHNIGDRAASVAVTPDGHYILIVREGVDTGDFNNRIYVLSPQSVTM